MTQAEKIKTKFSNRGLTITEKNGRIEVDSEIYNLETIYQDVTFDTELEQQRREALKEVSTPQIEESYGIHNPEMTTALIKEINSKSPVQFEDISWHNDTCDSIHNEEIGIKIYLPNSRETNYVEERFSRFVVETYALLGGADIEEEFETVDDIIEFINIRYK